MNENECKPTVFITKCAKSGNDSNRFLLPTWRPRNANLLRAIVLFLRLYHTLSSSLLSFLFLFLSSFGSFIAKFYLFELCREVLFQPLLAFFVFGVIFTVLQCNNCVITK